MNPLPAARRFSRGLRRLHLPLYFLFTLMLSLSGIVASLFEQYSVLDIRGRVRELRAEMEARERARPPAPAEAASAAASEPRIKLTVGDPVGDRGSTITRLNGLLLGLLLVGWLWPLYRHYFSRRPPPAAQVEQRIVDLPVFLFALTWLAAGLRYFEQVELYWDLHGEPDLRVKTTLLAAAVLLGTFAGYLNLELTQIYVRRRIARPYFAEQNPFGLKRGLRLGLTLRHALMIFSLAAAPLALCLYLPAFFNWDLIARVRQGTDRSLYLANSDILIPLFMMALMAVLMFGFHVLSVALFRWNVQGPLTALIRRMRAVAQGDFDAKEPVLSSDEIGQLKGHFNLMLDGLRERERIKDTFGRYVSVEIARKIIESGKVNLAGEEIEATVLFSDIRNFTPLSERLSPAELIQFLNAYFAHVTAPIMANGGVINKFIGDAVMAIFSPALGQPDHAAAAVRAALGMRAALGEFNRAGGHRIVQAGIGIHSGPLIAGNVGTEQRTEYTVLGDTVNVAARIEGATKDQGTDILVSAAVVSLLRPEEWAEVSFESRGPILLKGKSAPMELLSVETR